MVCAITGEPKHKLQLRDFVLLRQFYVYFITGELPNDADETIVDLFACLKNKAMDMKNKRAKWLKVK